MVHRWCARQRRGPRCTRARMGQPVAADRASRRLRRRLPGRCVTTAVAGDELMYRTWVLTALLVWPLIAGAIALIVPARFAKHAALVASLIEFALSVPLWWTFVPGTGMQLVADHAWIASWGIRYTVGVDGISFFMVLLTTFLMPLAILGSWSYIT